MKKLFAALWVVATFATPAIGCEFDQVTFDNDFSGARLNKCREIKQGSYELTITPENTPINDSPWYAFKVTAKTPTTIKVSMKIKGSKHRYPPKVSRDGIHWGLQKYTMQKQRMKFTLKVDDKPTWIAAQELFLSQDYFRWGEQLSQSKKLKHEVIGWSVQQRPIYKLEKTGQGHEWLIVLGRQHPPEVTGALALPPFVETLLSDSKLAKKFRQRYNLLVLPNLNPDGVYLGNWRHNANGVDLNRDWKAFVQPETRAVDQYLTRLSQAGQHLSMAVDFHSTKKDIFYTMPSDYGVENPMLVENWLSSLDEMYDDFEVIQKPGNNPDKGVFKQYFADKFKAHAITYEMGDNTGRGFIKTFAVDAANNLMKTMLALPEQPFSADTLIQSGDVYTGNSDKPQKLDIAVCGEIICGVYPPGQHSVEAKTVIDAKGKIVSPGFIDPHTHTLEELLSKDKNANLNYLTQGVTTVVNGNDGGGPVDIAGTAKAMLDNGIGTNVALLVGHGSIREAVMGRAKRAATEAELMEMAKLTDKAMKQGALGLSSGLYYVPGSFANTQEVVALAKVAAGYGGIYDTHLRDESTFNIGFLNALKEAVDIAKAADIHLHLAHIKALGVDVWGQSEDAIKQVEQAMSQGVSISADQYPWLASGTKLHSAVMPKWVMADSKSAFYQRLNNPALIEQIRLEVTENIRRRGGPKSILITAFSDSSLVGLNLAQIADKYGKSAVDTAIELVQKGDIRIASFNMSAQDVERFMVKPWVVTSSDGTNGHPRKYASFPQKYQQYVVKKKLLSPAQFINRSSAQTAKVLGVKDRGRLAVGLKADIIVIDPKDYAPKADFSNWDRYSTGVEQVLVNGQQVIKDGQYINKLAGQYVTQL